MSESLAQNDEGDTPVIDEILVTAQKRQQVAQDVTTSLFAVTGDSLRSAGIDSLDGIRDLAAGVEIVSSSPGLVQIAIRGVTNLGPGAFEATSAIGYYLDETPLSGALSTQMPEVSLWDTDRVEILRGPQGTLFGEGSMGGTIRVITNKPDPQAFYSRVSGEFASVRGGDTGATVRGLVNIPVVADELAVRANYSRTSGLGWIDVPDLDLTDTNDTGQTDVRLALGWMPTDRLNVDLSYVYQNLDLGNISGSTSPGVIDPRAQAPGAGPIVALDPEDNEYGVYNATVRYDWSSVTLESITSYFDNDHKAILDLSPLAPFFFDGETGDIRSNVNSSVQVFAQELRLVSKGDNWFDWIAGAYLKSNDRIYGEALINIVPGFGIDDLAHIVNETNIDSVAVFGEADYALSDRWSVQFGGRYYRDDRKKSTLSLATSALFGTVEGDLDLLDGSDSDFAPRLALTWTGENRLVYFSASKGFRSGGDNDFVALYPNQIKPTFGPEEVRTYEIGVKSVLARGRVQLNAYAYHNDWTDLQVELRTDDDLFFFVDNVGAAEAMGAELEILARPSAELTISVNLSYIDAELTTNLLDTFGDPILVEGNQLPFTPDFTLSTSFDYVYPLNNGLSGLFHARYAHRSANFSDAENSPLEKNDKYDQVSLRAGVEGETWGVYAFVENLFDRNDSTVKFDLVQTPITYITYVRPRTYGVELRWDFE